MLGYQNTNYYDNQILGIVEKNCFFCYSNSEINIQVVPCFFNIIGIHGIQNCNNYHIKPSISNKYLKKNEICN